MTRTLRLVALGGLGEVGMNCLVLEAFGRKLVVDCGVTFPDHEPGIDIIHPDFDYLLAKPDEVEAVVLTHGHEDHIGALPYLLRDLDLPVYGPAYALGLVEERLREADLSTPARLIETQPRRSLALGPFSITPFRVTHSMPDCTGLVVRLENTTLVHSGDFKIDPDPPDGEHFDQELLGQLGDEGVRLLLSDSTNAEVEGEAGSERGVEPALAARVGAAKGRVVVCMFASNVQRLAAVLRLARAHGRRVLFLGRALLTQSKVAERVGRLVREPDLFVSEREAATVPPRRLLVVATGSQGEPRAALRRLASGTHPALGLEPGDEVVLSSRVIPGRERQVVGVLDALERRGVRVWTRRDDPALHVSGHACRDEQRRMLELLRPRGFVPVHGTFLHLQRHAALARAAGVPEVLCVENGALVDVDEQGMRVAGETQVGRVHVQHGGEISPEVLRERSRMAEGGLVTVVVWLDAAGSLARPPELIATGVVDELDLSERALVEEATHGVTRALKALEGSRDTEVIEAAAGRAARRVFRDALGWRPAVHAVVRRTVP